MPYDNVVKRRRWLPQNRLLRALVFLLVGVATLELVYLIVANIALAVVAKKYASSEPVGVAFERGLTWFPGRIHLRGVRLHGADSGGWSVSIADADVDFAVWRVAASPRRVDSIIADVTSIELGKRRSKGALHVVVSDLTFDDPRVSFRADAKVDGATLENGGAVLANDVHGSIVLRVAPVDLSRRSLLDTTSGSISLDGAFLSLDPLASFASLATTQDRGTLHIAGSLDAGLLAPSSEIHAHTARATLKDARGASADFPRGLDVVVRVPPAMPTELQLAVQTPSLVFGSADPARPPDVFDDFELSVPAGSSDLKENRLAMRSLAWSTRRATIHEGATTLGASASGNLHFELGHEDELVADTGTIRATNVTVESPDVTDRTPFDARLVVERLTVSRGDGTSLRGPLHASGDDARPLVEMLVTSESIRRTLGPLAHRSFTLDATMNRSGGRLALDDVTLRAATSTLRGAYHRDETTSAAFLLENGPISGGILLHGKTESVIVGATASWLERELASMKE